MIHLYMFKIQRARKRNLEWKGFSRIRFTFDFPITSESEVNHINALYNHVNTNLFEICFFHILSTLFASNIAMVDDAIRKP